MVPKDMLPLELYPLLVLRTELATIAASLQQSNPKTMEWECNVMPSDKLLARIE
jgi:hypothetical protein